MPSTFLHTSDWHIAKPFGRFEPEQAGVLARARLDAIDRLAAAARTAGAEHVLVAGDVYDRPGLPDRQLRAPMARLAVHGDLAWHIIPGNHDAAAPGSVWERVLRDGLPGNVRLHLEPVPAALGADCILLPAPLTAKALSHDPTEWMDSAVTPAGMLRIGLAHGSVRGFGSDRSASVAIAPDRAKRAGLAYLALGDWHGVQQIGPRTWYSGTPEPDGFLDNDPGFALTVRIEDAHAPPCVERVATGAWRWLARSIDLARATDLDAVEEEVRRLGPDAGRTLIELSASGTISIGADADLGRRLDLLDASVFHLARRLDNVRVRAADDDLSRIGDPLLREVAGDLALLASDTAHPDAAAAERALRRLFALAADAGSPA